MYLHKEANWAALLRLLQIQLQLLQEEGNQLNALTTQEQLMSLMNMQLGILREDGKNTREDLQKEMTSFRSQMEKTAENFSAQAGNVSGKFGSCLSEAQQKMKKFAVRAFWISLIPSVISCLWCLIQQIFFLT